MLETFWQLKDELQIILMGIFIVIGMWRGAGPERACAFIYLTMWVSDQAYHALLGRLISSTGADLGHISIDVVASLSLIGIALYANRNYTLWLASMQLVALLSHFLRIISPSIDPTAYALLMASPMYLAVLIFAGGTIRHLRRQKRHGPYRSWRGFSPRTADRYWPTLSPGS